MNTYTVHMRRPTERTHNETLTLASPKIVVSFRLGHQNGFAMLAREMVARNLPDGYFRVIDPQHPVESLDKLMDWRTVHDYATLPVGEDPHVLWIARNVTNTAAPESETVKTAANKRERKSGLTMTSYEALGRLMRNSSEWKGMGGYTKGALLADNYVEMFEGRAVVTDAGRAAHQAFVPQVESSLSVHQQAAFELLPVAEEEWREKVPKGTRGVMNREGWVIIRNGIVYPTKAAPEGFGDNAPEFEPEPAPEIINIVSLSVAPSVVKTERMKPLSENWRAVLEHVQRGMAARTWEAFHGKTKKGLTITHKAVVLNENGKPMLTEIGLRAIETGKLAEAA